MRIVAALSHDEVRCGLRRPRHPILCGMDLFGLALTLWLVILYRPTFFVATLPLAVCLVYTASCTYHWMPYSIFLHKIDHQMITLLTGVTFVSYWSTKLPMPEMAWRLSLLFCFTAGVCWFRWRYFSRSAIGGCLYLALAAFSLTTSFYELQVWLPTVALYEFWIGIGCYFANFLIHSFLKPDPIPGFFGFRETQHLFVIAGTTLQSLVVLQNL